MAQNAIEKILGLLRLAEDPRTPKHEAIAAGYAAKKRMHELGISREDVDYYEEEQSERDQYERWERRRTNEAVYVDTPLVIVTESDDHYRVAKMIAGQRGYSSHFVLIPKRYVRGITWMEKEEVEATGWGSSQVTKVIALDPRYAGDAMRHGWNAWC